MNLYVEGEPDAIGTTASHPFWSQDRQAFVSAELLTATERLRLEDGRTAAVTRIEQLPGTQSVFNLEVDGEHVYHVGLNGLLVHNTCTPRTVVLGENSARLQKFADTIRGGQVYNPKRPFTVAKNERWLRDQIRAGKRIYDLGLDVYNPRGHSPFYLAEEQLLR